MGLTRAILVPHGCAAAGAEGGEVAQQDEMAAEHVQDVEASEAERNFRLDGAYEAHIAVLFTGAGEVGEARDAH